MSLRRCLLSDEELSDSVQWHVQPKTLFDFKGTADGDIEKTKDYENNRAARPGRRVALL